MSGTSGIIFYILIFSSLYVQVFLFVTFLENRKKIVVRKGKTELGEYFPVTIIVPCWNEAKTVFRTVDSLLKLNYPKDKLKIFLVDDGSTDNTWQVMQQFANHENIQIFQKENGGKYTALNLGLEKTTTPFVGCLDADSIADPESLVRIMSYFEKDPKVMAVAPSIVVANPQNVIQKGQEIEYQLSVFIKKMLGLLGAIHVTPGPLSIFRKKVFDDLGVYRHAHNTEDMEIAYRMQKHHYRIEHCNDAYVYTNTPPNIKKLFKQRLRWIYGFINNTLDYKGLILKKKYGNFSFFTLPAAIVSIISVGYLFSRIIYNLGDFVYSRILRFEAIGFNSTFNFKNIDLFYINTNSTIFLVVIVYFLLFFSIVLGQKMVKGKWKISIDIIYFLCIFGLVAPLWLIKAIYHTLMARSMPSWR
jgi:cellulose synthase/poly-beta-1,6-N-acetylglucosamine synthase-like glycosyltransferase